MLASKALADPDRLEQLRSLYDALLRDRTRYDEFRGLLALYDFPDAVTHEPVAALAVRQAINQRVRAWIAGTYDGMTPEDVLRWRRIVVEGRIPQEATVEGSLES